MKMQELQPVVFLGHGSPMNALSDTPVTRSWRGLGRRLPPPRAIVAVSAHWVTRGTKVLTAPWPPTIHDFFGFPKALFDFSYPAPGAPQTAADVRARITSEPVDGSTDWGLDHGTWSVLAHLYPQARIPVTQLSLNRERTALGLFDLGRELLQLRKDGVLVLASGNIVHNLQAISWEENAPAAEWALEADDSIQGLLEARDFKGLARFTESSESLRRMSHPTVEHLLPLLVAMGAGETATNLETLRLGIQNASVSMTGFVFWD